MINLWNAEPTMIMGALEAGLVLAVAFGVPINPDQKAAIVGFASAVIAVVGSVIVRSQVTPTK